MRITLVGLGYIGLPTALLAAKSGHEVAGFDVDARKIDTLNAGRLPFAEKGMEELFADAKNRFRATQTLESSDAYIIAVPTPVTQDHRCDLSYVERATASVAGVLKKGDIVVLESTVAPGTTEGLVKNILEKKGLHAGEDFSLAYVSEKAIPGNTIHEMIHNDRIIGGMDEQSREKTKELYGSFVKGEIIMTDCKTAETVKLVENAYRDVNIAFANELSQVLPKIGVNAWEVIRQANRHPRVHVHSPGPGVGGHCIALDPWFLIEQDMSLTKEMQEARRINDAMPGRVADAADGLAKKHGTKTIGVLGVAYKKNVDDARETPALPIIESLQKRGFRVLIHDPLVTSFPYALSPKEDVLREAEGIILVTDHDAFLDVPVPSGMKWILDTRALWAERQFDCEYILLGGERAYEYFG